MKAQILEWRGQRATVKDVIRTGANAMGGVHLGNADNSEEQLVFDFDALCTGDAGQMSIAAIGGLCRVVLRALQPLADAIVQDS